MGDLISQDRLIEKQIEVEARRELSRVYQLTAGFVDPEPPGDEQMRLMAQGVIEL